MKPLSVGPGDASAAAGTSSASIAAASNNTITANNTSRTTNTTTNGAPHATTTATDEANAPPKRKRSLLLQRPRLHRGRSQSVDLGNVEAPAVAAVAANRVADTSRSGGVETRVVAGADVLVSDLSSDEDLSARSSVSTVRRMSAPTATTSQALINGTPVTIHSHFFLIATRSPVHGRAQYSRADLWRRGLRGAREPAVRCAAH